MIEKKAIDQIISIMADYDTVELEQLDKKTLVEILKSIDHVLNNYWK
jgi:hypothetical protein